TFGHVAQMPQIVRGFGMDSFVFWRGLGDDSDRLGVAFRWRGPDGSTVLAIRQIDGYGAVDNLGRWARGGVRATDPAEYPEMALRRLKELRDIAAPYLERSGVIDLLAGNGTDHQLVQRDLTSLLAAASFAWPEAEFRIAGLDEYADAIRGRMPYLDVYEGEMCDGKDAPVLRGVNSARIHLKQRNEAVERALLEAEIAASLAHLATGAPYPAEDLRLAWRHLLRNHPHDSICGCSVDEVHRDMAWRFDAAEQLALRLRREALWKLAGGEAIWSYRERPNAHRTAVNLLPYGRRGLVELPLPPELAHARSIRAEGPDGELPAQLYRDGYGAHALVATEAPSLGASRIHLRSGRPRVEGARLVGYHAIENEHYHVAALPNGTLEILHKGSRRKLSGAHWLVDEADRGDEYNFCPVDGDTPWDMRAHKVRIRGGMRGPAVASLVLEMDARLPQGLRTDRRARLRQTVACPIRVEVRLIAGVERVEFVTTLENRAFDHRLRVVFPAGPAHEVRAEGHYAVIHRPVGAKQHGPDWKEPAQPTHHTLGGVEAGGVLLLGKGLPEYEVRHAEGGAEIALTLLRSVGWLSRDDLSTRPGGAGPHLATPEAQCLGYHRFEYAVSLVEDLADAELVRASHDYRFGLLAGPPNLESQESLRLEGRGFCLGALKGAEDGDGVVLRVYNPGETAAALAISGEIDARPCRLDEQPLEEPFDGTLAGGKIASFRLRRSAKSPLRSGEG
ncbi:MAG: glycoside hydrolase family 38 C-terminal domain-containing protein, partial [Sphingomonadaceae bacterium]